MPDTLINVRGQVVNATGLDVPPDRIFRDAWSMEGGAIVVDMEAARELHKDRLREERGSRFTDLDIEINKIMVKANIGKLTEQDKGALKISEKHRQKLRDVTDDPRIEAASTPDELKALTLDVLLND